MKNVINIFYYKTVSNFGDRLNVDIIEKLSGRQIQHKPAKKADAVAIGSLLQTLVVKKISPRKRILRFLRRPLIVYGTGFMYDLPDENVTRKLDVRAVRGKKSLKKLRELKYIEISKNVVLGDPGLLASLLIDSSKIKKKYKLGIVPHYVDAQNPLLKKIDVKNSVVLDITQRPCVFLKKMAQCECVISSAMHGLIAADSLGIPNARMILSDKIAGGDYKFDDYYSAFDIKSHKKIDLRKRSFTDKDTENIKQNYKITPEMVRKKQQDLISVFPF